MPPLPHTELGNQMSKTVLTVSNLTKRYPGTTALDSVSLDVKQGEVHVLVGENGAGKSTLVRCIGGSESPDEGSMLLAGSPYVPAGPSDSFARGIQIVHQELALLPGLSVAENLFVQKLPSRFGLVDKKALRANAKDLLRRVGLDISPDTKVETLGIAQMQLLEIAKALWTDVRLLVLDEPTATLTPPEVSRLFTIIRQLTEDGVGVIYISHHLEEIFEIGDRVTVLRNGRQVATEELSTMSVPKLVKLMVGRNLDDEYPLVPKREETPVVLRVTDLVVDPGAPPVSFSLHEGEILGIAGLVGSGRTEIVRAIFGADKAHSGGVELRGASVKIRSPRDAVGRRFALLTEDRKSQGLLLDMSIASNMSLASLNKTAVAGLLRPEAERRKAKSMGEKLRIKMSGVSQTPRALSGGNQQKVLLGRWLEAGPDVFIVDEPTRGIDVGARFEIHQLMRDLATSGKSLLVVSSDLPELVGICDRIVVLSRRAITGDVSRQDFDAEAILSMAYANYIHETKRVSPSADS